MKLSKILSIVLATLSVGVSSRPTTLSNDVQQVPADIRDEPFKVPVDIEKRAGHEETERFKNTQKYLGKQKLQLGKTYSFQVTWTQGAAGSTTKTTSPIEREMKKTQQGYGFDHTGIVVGEVVKVPVGQKYELDFKGDLYHLRAKLEGSGQKAWYKTWVESIPWDPKPTPKTVTALHLQEVSGKWEEKAVHANTAGRFSAVFPVLRMRSLKANSSFQLARLARKTATDGKANGTTAPSMSRLLKRRYRCTIRVELWIELRIE
ncbi:unnamed protein product [Aspergillus oryzae]|uniref:DNA, SC113 n=2 Tax=Aspergillus oryzae TaxID=5062 RepID=Q2U6X0_ASPOR|nr:unnamed protein product [Aspergillus oryzae RIB40]BAE62695.1 unnamed protein product [Aspergillus oryzae RIB40]GMF76239.1 unnamed protein product [Aspergillus oryzae]GMF96140.1 unnamed protein product [Aspergillus oryzae]GMG24948.1 unnamed protein product [Aspergillus oryzae]